MIAAGAATRHGGVVRSPPLDYHVDDWLLSTKDSVPETKYDLKEYPNQIVKEPFKPF